jgi:hypothetical protein
MARLVWGRSTACASPSGGRSVSGVQPDDNGCQNQHGAIIERAFLVTRRQPTPLFEPIDAALHHVAPRVDERSEDQRATWVSGPLRSLVASLWDGVLDLPLPQQAPTAQIAVALVSDEAIWAGAWSSTSTDAWDTNAVQDGLPLRAVMPLSWGDDNGEGSPAAVTGAMELGRQPSTAAPEPLVGWVRDPFFSSARRRRCRAPLAC